MVKGDCNQVSGLLGKKTGRSKFGMLLEPEELKGLPKLLPVSGDSEVEKVWVRGKGKDGGA